MAQTFNLFPNGLLQTSTVTRLRLVIFESAKPHAKPDEVLDGAEMNGVFERWISEHEAQISVDNMFAISQNTPVRPYGDATISVPKKILTRGDGSDKTVAARAGPEMEITIGRSKDAEASVKLNLKLHSYVGQSLRDSMVLAGRRPISPPDAISPVRDDPARKDDITWEKTVKMFVPVSNIEQFQEGEPAAITHEATLPCLS